MGRRPRIAGQTSSSPIAVASSAERVNTPASAAQGSGVASASAAASAEVWLHRCCALDLDSSQKNGQVSPELWESRRRLRFEGPRVGVSQAWQITNAAGAPSLTGFGLPQRLQAKKREWGESVVGMSLPSFHAPPVQMVFQPRNVGVSNLGAAAETEVLAGSSVGKSSALDDAGAFQARRGTCRACSR